MNQMMWDPAQGQYQTLKVRTEGSICFVQFYRPDANNTINDVMLAEMNTVLGILAQNSHPSQPRSADDICIVVFEGLPEVFCYGADFNALAGGYSEGNAEQQDPEFIYNVWQQMATGPFVTVAHVRGKVNAGGVGFVAACDIVLSDTTATFALSELLFGLIPACVMPFLVRKIGFQKAHYLTTSTQPINVQTAADWGLVDVYDENSAQLFVSNYCVCAGCLARPSGATKPL